MVKELKDIEKKVRREQDRKDKYRMKNESKKKGVRPDNGIDAMSQASYEKYNWTKIIAAWQTGRYTNIKELTKEFGKYTNKVEFRSTYAYFRRKLSKVKPDEEKKKAFSASVQAKVFEYMATDEAKIKKEYSKILRALKKKMVRELFKENPDQNIIRTYKLAMDSFQKLRQEEFEIYEIQEVAKKIESKLEIDKVDGVKIDFV